MSATVVTVHIDLPLFLDHGFHFTLTKLQQRLFATLAEQGKFSADALESPEVITAVGDAMHAVDARH